MKLFVYLFLIITLAGFTGSLNPNIINGEEATENQFPYQVGIYVDFNYTTGINCGGSLISQTFVITAAHCVLFSVPIDNIFVLLGSIYLDEGIRRDAINLIAHPEYGNIEDETLVAFNDIGLIEIDYVNYSDSIMNIALPDFSDYYPDYEASVVITSGWGQTNFTVVESALTLLYTALLVIRDEACMKMLGADNITVEDWICATSPIESGACKGDSGGPLVHRDSMVLIGITSRASNNCSGFFLSLFTHITYHRQWIWEMTGI